MKIFAESKWKNMMKAIKSDPIANQKCVNLECLTKDTIPSNQELGQLIQDLYASQEMTLSESKNGLNNTVTGNPGQSTTFAVQKTQS